MRLTPDAEFKAIMNEYWKKKLGDVLTRFCKRDDAMEARSVLGSDDEIVDRLCRVSESKRVVKQIVALVGLADWSECQGFANCPRVSIGYGLFKALIKTYCDYVIEIREIREKR